MKKLETKKETIINSHQVIMMQRIENEIEKELIKENVSFSTVGNLNNNGGNLGYLQTIRFTSKYADSSLMNKATAVFVISISIENKLIGMITYHYEVTPSSNDLENDIDWLNLPSFKDGNFKLRSRDERLFTSNIDEINNENK